LNSGHEVIAVAPRDEHMQAVQELGCIVKTAYIDSKGINPVKDLFTVIQLLTLFIHERPQTSLFFTAKPNIYGSWVAAFLGIPYINNISGLGSAFIQGGWLKSLLVFLYRSALINSSKVFFQNQNDLELFNELNLATLKQSGLLPGSGVDLNHFKPIEKNNSNSDKHPFSFVLIARMLKDKGVEEYVKAAKIVHQSFTDVQFKLLGPLGVDNPSAISEKKMKVWIEEGFIHYLGSADDVKPIIAESSCVVLPSYREGAPRTLLEAASMGKPIITTDVPGCRGIVEDGKTGFLCQVKNADDLAQKMIQMLQISEFERFEMGRLGRLKMEREFSEQLVIERYINEIRRLTS